MSMEFANRICPNCKNPNYMVFLGDFSKSFKYKCMNCNRYFNDVDFEEPIQPVWKTEFMNKKVDMVEVVRCKDCKHGNSCNDGEIYCEKDIGTFVTAVHKPDWFCADGERRTDDA